MLSRNVPGTYQNQAGWRPELHDKQNPSVCACALSYVVQEIAQARVQNEGFFAMIDTNAINTSFDLLHFCERITTLERVSRIEGGEWAGPCSCCGGRDRFHIQPNRPSPRWLCRKCTDGKWKDPIALVMLVNRCNFKDAIARMGGGTPITPQEAARLAAERAEEAQRQLEESIQKAQEALRELQQANRWQRYQEQLRHNEPARQEWRNRGIPDVYQEIFGLGFDQTHTVYTDQGKWLTPTLTIPIFELGTHACVNVRHRLLTPLNPHDKYRPERTGLPPALWFADPDLTNPGAYMVVEGEIKAAVSYLTADDPNLQTVGIPGKSISREFIASKLVADAPVFICYDPDAQDEAYDLALTLGERARVITLPEKIDDMIVKYQLDKTWLSTILHDARRIA